MSSERNKDIKLIGRHILEVRATSFYIDYKRVCEIIILFIKVDDGKWYKIVSSDGSSSISSLLEEPGLVSIDSIKDEFAYPVFVINKSRFLGKIVDIKEYLWKGRDDESAGFYFALESRIGFSIIDNDDCLSVHEGLISGADFELTDFSL